jgi:hypothetical protein
MPAALIAPLKPGKAKKSKAPKVQAPARAAFALTSAEASPAAPSAALAEPYGEALMPRWRRPSLRTARYASPRNAPEPVPAMIFAGGASAGLERRLVRYDLVALTDIPDEVRGAQVGQLQANDEVEITGRQGAWVKIRTPLGAEGWIHRTTLQATDDAPDAINPVTPLVPPVVADAPLAAIAPDPIETDVAMGAFAAATAARTRALETAQITTAVDEPAAGPKPVKRTRTHRPTNLTPAPKPARKAALKS